MRNFHVPTGAIKIKRSTGFPRYKTDPADKLPLIRILNVVGTSIPRPPTNQPRRRADALEAWNIEFPIASIPNPGFGIQCAGRCAALHDGYPPRNVEGHILELPRSRRYGWELLLPVNP